MAKKSSFDQLILLPAILHASIQDIFIELTVHFEGSGEPKWKGCRRYLRIALDAGHVKTCFQQGMHAFLT
jgi:hypothetical protein